ncbi:unnamed protein product, partial [Bubo scandiacus]
MEAGWKFSADVLLLPRASGGSAGCELSPAQYSRKGHGAPRGTQLSALASVAGRCKTITDPCTECMLVEISPKVCDTAKLGHT